MQQQNGYVLLFVLFFLCCTLLCSSVLVLNLSHQIQASNETVEKEKSRLLANSGWNLALEQLQLLGKTSDIQHTLDDGALLTQLQKNNIAPAAWEITSTGTCGTYSRTVSGIVQCFSLPFSNTAAWPVLSSLKGQAEAGILLVEDINYQLQSDCVYPLGIASADMIPLLVEVTDEITAKTLYIHGDLSVSGSLTVDALYVSGDIYGIEQVQCDAIHTAYNANMPYQIRILERNAV